MIAAAIILALCPAEGFRRDCIVDGDTLWVGREKVRLANIDAPEIHGQCAAETARAVRARDRLLSLTSRGFQIRRAGQDRYGRTLATLSVGGRDVGRQLVAEGLARRWAGRRQPWCQPGD